MFIKHISFITSLENYFFLRFSWLHTIVYKIGANAIVAASVN